VITRLEQLFNEHGRPDNIRSDNRPEFVAEAVEEYLTQHNVETRFIELGAP
jgi:hypothetical protein